MIYDFFTNGALHNSPYNWNACSCDYWLAEYTVKTSKTEYLFELMLYTHTVTVVAIIFSFSCRFL